MCVDFFHEKRKAAGKCAAIWGDDIRTSSRETIAFSKLRCKALQAKIITPKHLSCCILLFVLRSSQGGSARFGPTSIHTSKTIDCSTSRFGGQHMYEEIYMNPKRVLYSAVCCSIIQYEVLRIVLVVSIIVCIGGFIPETRV